MTGEMWKNKRPFPLALNQAASDDIAWQCKHYTGRGVMKLRKSGTAPAEGMGVPVSKMPGSIEALCQASLKASSGRVKECVESDLWYWWIHAWS